MNATLSYPRQRIGASCLLFLLVRLSVVASISATATAQVRTSVPEDDTPPSPVDRTVTQTATVATGRIGTRQTREDAARATGIEPLAKINNRISNRVQSRLQNRLDRNYSERPHLR